MTLELERDGGQGATSGALPPSVLFQALGSLAYERHGNGATSVAVDQFCAALVADSPAEAKAYASRLLACGMTIDTLYESVIPRVAARLGELWLADEMSFTTVTLGMARLTEVFRSLSPGFMKVRRPMVRGRRALLALTPGEEHALGVVMAADYFQRAGWSVQVELRAPLSLLEDMVAAQHFDVIGLSAGSRRVLPMAERAIGRLRELAAPDTRFALGGQLVAMEPEVVQRLGCDLDGRYIKEILYQLDVIN